MFVCFIAGLRSYWQNFTKFSGKVARPRKKRLDFGAIPELDSDFGSRNFLTEFFLRIQYTHATATSLCEADNPGNSECWLQAIWHTLTYDDMSGLGVSLLSPSASFLVIGADLHLQRVCIPSSFRLFYDSCATSASFQSCRIVRQAASRTRTAINSPQNPNIVWVSKAIIRPPFLCPRRHRVGHYALMAVVCLSVYLSLCLFRAWTCQEWKDITNWKLPRRKPVTRVTRDPI